MHWAFKLMESCAIQVDIIIINSATEPDCVGAFPSSPTLPQEKKKILYTEAETSSTVHRGCEEFYSTQKLWGVILYTETETCSTVHRSWDILYCTQKLRGTLVHRSCEFYCTQKLWGVLLNTEAVTSSAVHRRWDRFCCTHMLRQVQLYTDAETNFYCTAVNEDDNWRCSGVPPRFKTTTWPCKESHCVPCLAASSVKHPWSVCQSALGHQSQPCPSKSHSLQLITNHKPRPPVD